MFVFGKEKYTNDKPAKNRLTKLHCTASATTNAIGKGENCKSSLGTSMH
jgi:hypothetical protein